MSEQELNEILKSYFYGMTAAEIAELYDISTDEAEKLIAENAENIEQIKAYRKELEA